MHRFRFFHLSLMLFSAFTVTTFSLGCREHPQVTRENVPNHDSIQIDGRSQGETATTPSQFRGAPTQRMLVAVRRHADKAWFLKAVADVDQFGDRLIDQFHELIKSIEFPPGDQPSWQLPDEWRQEDGSGMRFATLRGGDVEISVISLPVPDGDESQYLLSNINRWRSQLQLPPIAADQLENETQQIESADGAQTTLVDLRGWEAADEMRPSFVGSSRNLPTNHPPIGASFGAASPSGLTYEIPAGWQEAKSGGMRRAAFQVTDGEQKIEITVIDLAGGAGDLLANVNRWRDQVGLGPLASVDAIDSTKVEVDGRPATYVRIEGNDGRAIWATIVPDQGRDWFLKLTGDLQLAKREEPAFRSFVETVRFGD